MSTVIKQTPAAAREVLHKHRAAIGPDAAVIESAIDLATTAEQEAASLRTQLECLRTERAFRRLELTKAALAGLLAGRHEELPDASAVKAVSNTAVRVADAALAALQRIQDGGAA